METNVCFVYPWATFGGVERVLLNRALVFQALNIKVKIDLLFLHDAGGIAPLKIAIKKYRLEDHLEIVTSLVDRTYDLISLIDCPQAIAICEKHALPYIMECHTSYSENRKYLSELTDKCKALCVPSNYFKNTIAEEIPKTIKTVTVLRNFVPWDIEDSPTESKIFTPNWTRKPILFLGRMDSLKNPLELLDAFQIIKKQAPSEYMLVFCGPISSEIDIHKEILDRNLQRDAIILPPLPFSSCRDLLISIASLNGIFVSPSTAESFGLSAAEAICCGLPVVLSDIPPHSELVNHDSRFLYVKGNSVALAQKIIASFKDYHNLKDTVNLYRENLSAHAFLEDWQNLLTEIDIGKNK